MRATFSLFLLIQSVSGWMHPKCHVYNTGEYFPTWNYCPLAEQYTAACRDVTAIEEDLLGLPSNINTLCISMKRGGNSSMSLGFFARFQYLEYLFIGGCFPQILPAGNSQGLQNLQHMHINGLVTGCCDCHIGPNTFRDLVKLSNLTIFGYRLSAMAPDVFHYIPQLQSVYIHEPCVENLSEILCRIVHIISLTKLNVHAPNIQSLNQSNCSILKATESNLTSVNLDFGQINHIEEGALACLQNLTRFSGGLNQDVLLRLPLSGIKQIQVLYSYGRNSIDFESICNVVFLLSIKEIHFANVNTSSLSMSSVELCIGLEYMGFDGPGPFHSSPHLKLNFISSLKNLKMLYVSGQTENSLDLCSFRKQPITWLTELTFMSSNVQTLFAKRFSCLQNLRSLDLSCSFISNIEDFAFFGLANLESLHMTQNSITQLYANTFIGLHSLTLLDLRENPQIYNIETMSFAKLTCLRQVFLGYLNYPPREPVIKLNLTLVFGDVLSHLTHLHISSGIRPMQLIIGSNITSKQNLSLQLKGQTVSFEDCDRPFFQSVTHLHADAEEFLCGSEFMGKYFRSVETFVYRSKLSAKSVDLTSMNQLIHLRKLTLVQVDLLIQRSADIIFHNLTKLEVLKLSNCRIDSLEGGLTKDFKSLKTLYLRIENIYNVIYSFTEHLSSLKYLILDTLQMFCSCDNAWLIAWAKGYRPVEVIMLNHEVMYNLEDLICLSDNGLDTPNFVKYTEANCTTEVGFVLFAATGLGVIFFMLVVLVHNLTGPYLLPLYYIILGWLSEAMRSNTRGRYHYDAFVSYSGKDERWLVEELLPNLEKRGPPFLRLCLHSRDFQLGKDIVENITDSLYRSRRTLCLVSRHYLHSNWCSLEMKLATSRLQVEQRDILLLVFLEKIPPRRLSAHHRLARLVKTRTYLDWPQDPHQHQAFWDRLWAKLKPPTEA